MPGQRVHVFLAVFSGQGDEQIQIADGFLAAAERSGSFDRADEFAVTGDVGGELGGFGFHEVDQEAPGDLLVDLDGFQDIGFTFFAEAGKFAELAFAGEGFDGVDGAGFEGAPEQGDFLGAERLQVEQVENRGRIFLQELLAQAVVVGLENFLNVLGHAVADAGQFGELGGIERQLLDRFRNAGDQLGGFFVAAIAADDRAIDFEQLRGLAQDAGDFTIIHDPCPDNFRRTPHPPGFCVSVCS